MNIDLLSPESFALGQPHGQFAWLREHDPVHFHAEPNGPGFWAVTRHADVFAVDRDFKAFSSEPTIMIQDPAGAEFNPDGAKMMLMMDRPEHTGYRKLIRAEFTAPSARLRQARIRDLARHIVDTVIDHGECDFVADIAGEMPSYVIAELMGMPLEDGRELYTLTETIHTAPEALPPGAGADAVGKMFAYASDLMARKRAAPGDDLASRLLAAEVDGRRLTDPEFLLFFLLLVDAGGDTTRNLLSAGLLGLMDHPDQFAWLLTDLDGRLDTAREELLRWTSPVIYMRRTARARASVGGQAIAPGDKVVMYFGSANRDGAAFEAPDALDLARAANPHLAFGAGAHVCLGQHIARIEIDAMLREVLTRMTSFELASAPEWPPSNFISGPKNFRLKFKRRA